MIRRAISDGVIDPLAFVVSLAIVIFLHVVIGEMVPKNIALARPSSSVPKRRATDPPNASARRETRARSSFTRTSLADSGRPRSRPSDQSAWSLLILEGLGLFPAQANATVTPPRSSPKSRFEMGAALLKGQRGR